MKSEKTANNVCFKKIHTKRSSVTTVLYVRWTRQLLHLSHSKNSDMGAFVSYRRRALGGPCINSNIRFVKFWSKLAIFFVICWRRVGLEG